LPPEYLGDMAVVSAGVKAPEYLGDMAGDRLHVGMRGTTSVERIRGTVLCDEGWRFLALFIVSQLL